LNVLIVDDEPLARRALESALRARADISQLDSAGDAVTALNMLRASAYDVLMLDIQMPEVSGLELLDQLLRRNAAIPSVVFVTAHNEHAIAAFERHAVDYVLKPFSPERIQAAVDEAVRRSQAERAVRFMAMLPQLQAQTRSIRVAVKSEGRILFIDPLEVSFVQAERNYVLLQRRGGSHLLRESISNVAEMLKPYGFIRIHRSVIVNVAFVAEIHPWPTGEYVLKMRDGKEFTVTRTYKDNLTALARLWIGTDSFAAGNANSRP